MKPQGYPYSYHDSVNESGITLDTYESKAMKQGEIILNFFKKHPTDRFTTYAVHRRLNPDWPESSTKRAITNLTKAGKLVKRNEEKDRRKEKYGRSNATWELHHSQYKQGKLF